FTEQEVTINQAIERGVEYLRQFLAGPLKGSGVAQNFSREGVRALVGFTLLECGVPADDPAVREVAELLRASARQLQQTYPLALAVIFLDRLGDSRDEELIRTLTLRLVAGQDPSGAW